MHCQPGIGGCGFKFGDKAASFRSLQQTLVELHNSSFRLRCLAIDLISRMTRSTAWSPQDPSSQNPDLATTEEALQFGSVSERSDKPILLGSLLNLVVSKILTGPEHTRIHQTWLLMPSALRCIAKGIVFLLGPRLGGKDYRWAPARSIFFLHESSSGNEARWR